MTRPYFRHSTKELRELFERGRADPAVLRALLAELGHRKRAGASRLRVEVEGALAKLPAQRHPSTNQVQPSKAPSVAPTSAAIAQVKPNMGGLKPTAEQQEALQKFQSGRSLKISAFAGTGKTSTLTLLASSRKNPGIYLAFNKAIAAEARGKFPPTVDCRTTHSLAWQAIQPAYGFSSGKMTEKLQPLQLAEFLALRARTFAGRLKLTDVQQAHLLLRTLQRYCQSDADELTSAHIPQYGRLLGLPPAVLKEVHAWVLDEAKGLWAQMIEPRSTAPLGHDGYLKLWALRRPKLAFQYILLDEAQDTNAVILGVLQNQDAQLVYVGDRHQQIYEWRGAVNAMEKIQGCEEAYLTESFRFGPAIAEAASQVLSTLGEWRRLTGNRALHSQIVPSGEARTVLARTNATLIAEALEALNRNLRPHVVGGVTELKRLISDVFELKKGNPGSCSEFFGFANWAEVVEFAETEEGEHLQTFVKLVQQHGERKLWAAVHNTVEEEAGADVLLSTAHKAKGREWDAVRLAPDFLSSRLSPGHPDAEAEVRLFYVAMTRAKRILSVDPEMLTTFASGSWQTRPPSRGPQRAAQRPVPPSPAHRAPARPPIYEGNRPAAQPAQPPRVGSESAASPPTLWQKLTRWLVGE